MPERGCSRLPTIIPVVHNKLIDPRLSPPAVRPVAGCCHGGGGAEVELITPNSPTGRCRNRRLRGQPRLLPPHFAAGPTVQQGASALPEMRRLRRRLENVPDPMVTHYQWLTMPRFDHRLISKRHPRLMTAHYIPPPGPNGEAGRGREEGFRRNGRGDRPFKGGASRLVEEVGLPEERVRVIPHGAFDYLTRLPEEAPLSPELADSGAEAPGHPLFGLLRPCKGIDDPRGRTAGCGCRPRRARS